MLQNFDSKGRDRPQCTQTETGAFTGMGNKKAGLPTPPPNILSGLGCGSGPSGEEEGNLLGEGSRVFFGMGMGCEGCERYSSFTINWVGSGAERYLCTVMLSAYSTVTLSSPSPVSQLENWKDEAGSSKVWASGMSSHRRGKLESLFFLENRNIL
jgi:hypothetical protein